MKDGADPACQFEADPKGEGLTVVAEYELSVGLPIPIGVKLLRGVGLASADFLIEIEGAAAIVEHEAT